MAVELATAYVSLAASGRGLGQSIASELGGPLEREGARAGDKASKSFGGTFSKGIGRVAGAAGGLLAAHFGVKAIGGFVSAASDLNETISKSNTIFGKNAREIEKWADGASRAFGQSKEQALESAASFGNMFQQLGIGSDTAADMSTQMTELASDFASFHNADITQVLEAQAAAFRGEYDAVQRFVPTINAAAVEQKALEMGLGATTKELDAQDKALATQALLLEGAGAAAGDFARTSDGLANQQRTLGAVWADLQAQLGQRLIPLVTEITGWLADNLPKAIDIASRGFDTIQGIVDRVTDAFGEGGLKGALTEASVIFGELWTWVRPKLMDFLASVGTWVVNEGVPAVARLAGDLAVALADFVAQAGPKLPGLLWDFVNNVDDWFSEHGRPALKKMAGDIGTEIGKAMLDGAFDIFTVSGLTQRLIGSDGEGQGSFGGGGFGNGSFGGGGFSGANVQVTGRTTSGGTWRNLLGLVEKSGVSGVKATSVFRPGATTLSGNTSYHASGRAVDLVSHNLGGLQMALQKYAPMLKELIGPIPGLNWRNGAPHRYSSGIQRQHYDHVHLAMHTGGVVDGPVGARPWLARDERLRVLQVGEEVIARNERGRGDTYHITAPGVTAQDIVHELEIQSIMAGVR